MMVVIGKIIAREHRETETRYVNKSMTKRRTLQRQWDTLARDKSFMGYVHSTA